MNFLQFSTVLFLLFILSFSSQAQHSITGTFPAFANQQIRLTGFEGFGTYTIDNSKANAQGVFSLSFSKNDFGMAYLAAEDGKSFIVILASDENLVMKGETLSAPQTITILSGRQNLLFEQYAIEHPRREQALSAWDYQERICQLYSLFCRLCCRR